MQCWQPSISCVEIHKKLIQKIMIFIWVSKAIVVGKQDRSYHRIVVTQHGNVEAKCWAILFRECFEV